MPRATRQKPDPDLAPVREGPDPHMHRGKCTICRHPQRVEIERVFIDWASPLEITRTFGLGSRATVYRHARARGLFEIRRRNLQYGLGRIAEHAAEVKPSAANVIAAFIAMAKINARGEWDNGHRFDGHETTEHARWELLATAARENELEDTLAGDAAPVQAEQNRLRELDSKVRAETATRAAAKAAEPKKEAEPEEESEQQEAEEAEAAEEQVGEQEEQTQAEQTTQPDSVDPSDLPNGTAQEKKHHDPESPRPHPTPQPPESAPRPEDSGPPQVAGLPWPWPREKITFARRWRPPRR